MVSKAVKLALQIVGYVFTLGEAIEPSFSTFNRIIAEQNVGPNTCLPYELIWINGMVQLPYAIRTQNWWEAAVYGIVVLITLRYCWIYIRYSINHPIFFCLALWMVVLKVLIFGALVAIELTVFRHGHSALRDEVHGILVVVITLLMSISPAKETWDAYRTHEVGGLDILLSLGFLCNSIIATVSGCLPFNRFEIICGVVGIACAGCQCLVWLRCQYHNHNLEGQGVQGWNPIDKLVELMGRG